MVVRLRSKLEQVVAALPIEEQEPTTDRGPDVDDENDENGANAQLAAEAHFANGKGVQRCRTSPRR
jgi:hypothetical protein